MSCEWRRDWRRDPIGRREVEVEEPAVGGKGESRAGSVCHDSSYCVQYPWSSVSDCTIMTVEMSARVTKVKEEVEDTKPDFQHDQSDHSNVTIKEEGGLVDNVKICHGCGQIILDKWVMKVGDTNWHSQCLRCSVCHTHFGVSHESCFLKYDQVFCKTDYMRSVKSLVNMPCLFQNKHA